MQFQQTVAHRVSCEGIGLHRGQSVRMVISPAPANSGIRFVRADLPARPMIRACYSQVVDTAMATTLGVPGATLATVEHLLAALAGLGIDNARVEVWGSELPILDGSAAPFVALLQQAGVRTLRSPRIYCVIQQALEVVEGDKFIRVEPASDPCFSYAIDFPHPLIGRQQVNFRMRPERFCREIAPARTFGFLKDVEALQANGLALGGSLDNALVLTASGLMNPGGLRFADEFVRHKLLDFIGDLALLGWPIHGHLQVVKGSHALHHRFMEVLASHTQAWRLGIPGTLSTDRQPESGLSAPARLKLALA
ncbi:MAG: UDP-3-O-acyl-N-acetylglucosamine deacetylase [Deltaproteobacteria bacterium]|nr:UDP-3-O-acyl-N-acetylglucosamine deacetylase [Deltaproteobacteria bacterium]MBW1951670.1 UDP-3-O-acyl-N-acetylglucosamine deacetylase [Deltaproteobacteria bacterium]MBW1985769.1 UDP-3-O-acyl-N-acetylglucosamine deacetylase [Deltaproteobacteria bacterium]MBW2134684.1 UDP-3-O-acyl-N-acetylglucosamine deacetylase [Deltaproteobacteria bacterium]